VSGPVRGDETRADAHGANPPGYGIVRCAAGLVPPERRREWLDEWRSELVHARAEAEERGESSRSVRFRMRARAAGSLRDALTFVRLSRSGGGGPVLRDALRAFRRQPGFLAAVVLTLGLGMGATTAIFSVLDALLLDPLPFEEPDRLVQVGDGRWPAVVEGGFAEALRSETRIFSAVHLHWQTSKVLTGAGEPRQLRLLTVEPGFLAFLGLRPRLGRDIGPEETTEGRDRVVVLADEIWRGAFNADPGIIGQTVRLGGEQYTVIGTLPPTLRYFAAGNGGGLVHGLVPLVEPLPAESPYAFATARLGEGMPLEAAEVRAEELGRILDVERPREGGWKPSIGRLQARGFRNERQALLALSGAALFLLLIACANAAGLLFVRGLARESELAVRRALGASRWAVFRQLLAESAVLAILAGAVGTLIAWWGVRGLLALAPETMVRWQYNVVTVDGRVLLFALVLTALTGLFFGMIPAAWAARRTDPTRTGRSTTASRSQMRTRRLVQVVQIALAVILLFGAGLLGRSFQRLATVDPGFDASRILELSLSASAGRTAEERAAFNRQLDERLQTLPGVERVGWSNGNGLEFPGALEVDDGERVSLGNRIIISSSVDTGFLRVMGIPILEGRGFTAADVDANPRPVIVDRDLAALLWPDRSALGRRYRRADGDEWYTVVGVARDAKLEGPDDRQMPWNVYYPSAPERAGYAAIRIRTRPPPASLVEPVRQAVHALDPDLPIYDLLPAREAMREEIEQPRFVLVTMLVFAVLALLLASIGVYGLVAFSVAQRSRELGIRMALGARDSQVVWGVFGEGMGLAVAGAAIGLAGAAVLSRFIEGLLFEISTKDAASFLLAPAVLALACAAALFAPARRAASVDPAATLRSD